MNICIKVISDILFNNHIFHLNKGRAKTPCPCKILSLHKQVISIKVMQMGRIKYDLHRRSLEIVLKQAFFISAHQSNIKTMGINEPPSKRFTVLVL